MERILIIEQGYQAMRLHRAYQELGYETVAIYSKDNEQDPYIKQANLALLISNTLVTNHRQFFYTYISIAHYTGCTITHPGTDSLATDYYFAQACELSNITLLGNTSDSLKKLKISNCNKALAKLHELKDKDIEAPLEQRNISKKQSCQLIYSSIGTRDSSYMGSLEFYKRNSGTKNLYISSPCKSVQPNDFINLNRFCKELIYKFQLVGIVCFNFTFDRKFIYLYSITPSLSPFITTLENRINLDSINYQSDLFINGRIKYVNNKETPVALSKNIFARENSTVKRILYPGGRNISYNLDLYNGKKLSKFSQSPIAILTSYGKKNVVNRLIEAAGSFSVETIKTKS